MEKKTILAVILSTVVIVLSMVLQPILFPRPEPAPGPAAEKAVSQPKPEVPAPAPTGTGTGGAPLGAMGPGAILPEAAEELREESFILETNTFRAVFTNRGGLLTSLKLKQYTNRDGSPVEMVLPRQSGRYPFSLHFGDFQAPEIDALFHTETFLAEKRIDFYRSFTAPSGIPFTLRKSFLFKPDDYLIELKVTIENSVNDVPALNFNGTSYTLGFGPQIGPDFQKLDRKNEFRDYVVYSETKKRTIKIDKTGLSKPEERLTWAAIVGKYFAVIALPDATQYRTLYDTRPLPGLSDRVSLYFMRPELRSSKNTDVFRFYLGPKKREILLRYNEAEKNAFKIVGARFEEIISSSILIGWLANILKVLLELFYRVIPNYGVAIILLTILIKALTIPLTQKSYESTSKMQTLTPRMNEIREHYKNNPQKMNQEIAALYKKEGINPLGGCLPMLLQLPIFFALYSLLSDHFELRGASFLPPWIVDLSAPESLWSFAPFSIPFVGWQELRALPFLMLITTFIQSKLGQMPDSSGGQMKMMMYLMPLMFFFILYDMPSGLVLYWTVQNILSIFQQLYINKRRAAKKA